jgi:hypothetical protein
VSRSPVARTTDPDGREVVFDAGSHLHLALGRRDWLLDEIELIMGAVGAPDHVTAIRVPDASASIDRTLSTPAAGCAWSSTSTTSQDGS